MRKMTSLKNFHPTLMKYPSAPLWTKNTKVNKTKKKSNCQRQKERAYKIERERMTTSIRGEEF